MIKFEYDKKERFLTVFTLNKSSSLINLKFKFPKRLNMKLSLIFFLFLFTLSCKKENTRYTVIPIKNFSQEIEMDRIPSDIQILRLNIPDTTFIGQIKDLAIYRDSIYILDDIKQSLFIFDMQGNFIQETCRSGRGPGEYIHACSIECDSSFVYVLDMPGKKLIYYDHSMNFVIAKNLSYTSSDFKITDKHFLFNNLEDIDGNYYYLYRDRDMNEVDHFIPYKPKWGHTLHGRGTTGQMFTWNESTKQSFLVRPFSNQIYEFTPAGKLQLSFEIDFGNKTIPDRIGEKDFNPGRSPFIYIEDFFDFNHFKMMSFLEKNTRYYTLFSSGREIIYAGRIKDSQTLPPFFPRWQCGNRLIGTCRGEYLEKYLKAKGQQLPETESDKNYLLFYALKFDRLKTMGYKLKAEKNQRFFIPDQCCFTGA